MAISVTALSDFKILSYNVHGLPVFGSMKKLNTIAEKLDNYDIVCLQELWTRKSRAPFLGTFPYIARGKKGRFPQFGDGLMTLSKYPIIDQKYISFKKKTHVEIFVKKGVLWTKINVNGTLINVYNTHLQSQGFPGAKKITKNQLAVMAAWEAWLTNKKIPSVFCGDFNLRADRYGPTINKLLKAGDTLPQDSKRLDYILLRNGYKMNWQSITAEELSFEDLSDHPAIEVVVDLTTLWNPTFDYSP